ncbi:hypothetical protein BDFB_015000 [Asbolus verrucosus]|uniref:HTH 29 domain containing protein n=1 Tax=Asbolus verrucosus TaxID=1661398 RepID=A0A482VAP9_ASBVE|nr:hypothetical protein BDFB_015000 [Asbolus verrucosus]
MTTGILTWKQLKERIIDAFPNGERQVAISRRIAISRYTVCRVLKPCQEHGYLEHMPKCGRPRKITQLMDRRIK